MPSNRKFNKKAVSPLIATVLLIAFAVALGAVVMNWGRSFTEQTADNVKNKADVDVKCSQDVQIKLLDLGSRPQMCYGEWGSGSWLNFTALNNGQKEIKSVQVMMIGDTGIIGNTSVANSSLPIAGWTKISVPYMYSSVGALKKVRLTPVVEINGKQVACAGSGSVLEKDVTDLLPCNST